MASASTAKGSPQVTGALWQMSLAEAATKRSKDGSLDVPSCFQQRRPHTVQGGCRLTAGQHLSSHYLRVTWPFSISNWQLDNRPADANLFIDPARPLTS